MGASSSCSAGGTLTFAVFVARQAIFDANLRIHAYELLFRSCKTGPASVVDENRATADVIANGVSLVMNKLGNRPAFINFPEELLLKGAPLALPPKSCVIEILETVTPSEPLLKALEDYRNQGYTLALDDYVGQPELAPLLDVADIIKVDVQNRPTIEVIKLSQRLRPLACKLLAEKVEDQMTFELCMSLGFDLFQGYHFSRPVIHEGTVLKTNEVARLRVLREISSDDYHVNKVAKIISQDSGLSYRLLKHLNTPHFSFRGKVHSLVQAVTLMGGKPLKQWLMLVMLADMGEGGPHEELVYHSVCRGAFLERLATDKPLPPYSADTLFLVGLFSNLDALLHQPMSAIVAHLPFDTTVVAALLGEQNPVRTYLDLSIQLESGEWNAALAVLEELQLPQEHVAALYAQSADWSNQMLGFENGPACQTQDTA